MLNVVRKLEAVFRWLYHIMLLHSGTLIFLWSRVYDLSILLPSFSQHRWCGTASHLYLLSVYFFAKFSIKVLLLFKFINLFFYFFISFWDSIKLVSCSLAGNGFRFLILFASTSWILDYRCILPCPIYEVLEIEPRILCLLGKHSTTWDNSPNAGTLLSQFLFIVRLCLIAAFMI